LTYDWVYTYTVDDVTNPIAVCQNITVQLDASGNATIVASDIDNGSSDNCGIASMSLDITSFDCTDLGPNTVILTVEDICGNQATCNATVTVVDIEPPVISSCPADITVTADTSYCGAVVSWIAPTATDNCSVVVTSTHNPGDTFTVGTTTVTYTATDAAGLTDQCSFDITVDPPALPSISGPASVCNLTTASYAVTDPGSHTFLWTVTNGTILGSDTNSTVDIAWTSTGQGTVSIDITSGSGCTNSNSMTVDVTTAAQTGTINSSTSLTRR